MSIEDKEINPGNYIVFWNNLPNVPKMTRTDTKIYRQTIKYLTELECGNFGKAKHFIGEYVDSRKFKHYLSKKWTAKEIYRHLEICGKLYQLDYLPISKKYLPKSLDSVLYMPFNGYSNFLRSACFPPKQKEDLIIDTFSDYEKKMSTKFIPLFTNLTKRDIMSLHYGIRSLIQYYEKVKISRNNIRVLGDRTKFLNEYKRYIVGDKNWTWVKENMVTKGIRAQGKLFDGFIGYCEKEYGVKFIMKDDTL